MLVWCFCSLDVEGMTLPISTNNASPKLCSTFNKCIPFTAVDKLSTWLFLPKFMIILCHCARYGLVHDLSRVHITQVETLRLPRGAGLASVVLYAGLLVTHCIAKALPPAAPYIPVCAALANSPEAPRSHTSFSCHFCSACLHTLWAWLWLGLVLLVEWSLAESIEVCGPGCKLDWTAHWQIKRAFAT